MDSKQRIKQFIDYKQLDYYPFEMKCGLSNGSLKKATGVSTTSLEKIHNAFPELNMDWVVTGRGEMIVKEVSSIAAEDNAVYGNNFKEKYYECIEKYNSLLEELADKKRAKGA